jgi:hypothetical protein
VRRKGLELDSGDRACGRELNGADWATVNLVRKSSPWKITRVQESRTGTRIDYLASISETLNGRILVEIAGVSLHC